MNSSIDSTVHHLRQTLDALRDGQLQPEVVCARFRMASLQWPGLPARYGDVLERLLQPLDTATMIGEESCSFSRSDMLDALHQWLDHAAQLPRS
ncbi:MAG: hypothetical protein CFE46_00120 [Burkholderiales bacterium PBB6]|jgi:hypothetical protein|uniref:Uncharacterized protein n=1 Tax=Ideonella margarita TaxID=2984191 RepID=A0ABU9C6N7_9BURK|nr:MAG: hypothetical protein CFE46_00120 [Burkholderiales bacterium PBB6]